MTSTQLIIIGIAIAINLIAFVLVGYDKERSVSAERRVPEVYFFFWSIFFSSFGVLAGMLTFHHKTRKWTFIIGITALLLEQSALLYFLLTYK
jgi:uncharacterized membrane protein YsdA (DUF1294 family)